MHFLFCGTNQKNMLQKETKDWAFEIYLLTGEPSQFLIPPDWIIENDFGQVLCVSWIFFLSNCFLWTNVFLRLSKITVTCLNSICPNSRSIMTCLKSSTIIFELLQISKMTSLKIFIFPVIEKLEKSNLDNM